MAEYARFKIKVDGSEVQEDIQDDVMEIVIDNNLNLPDMVVLQLFDDDLKWVDDARFDLGKTIEVSVDNVVLFAGEMTSLEPDFAETGRATLLVRGYDQAHRLQRGRKTRTFLKMKDSDIVSKIAREAGLSANTTDTKVTHDYVVQNNQTDMEFLLSRAQRVGYQLYVQGTKLFFKSGDTAPDGPELEWGETLRSFRPRWAGSHQVGKFEVYGWDNVNKVEIKGTATPQSVWTQGGLSNTGGALADKAFGKQTAVLVNHSVANKSEADALALALSHEASSQFVQAEGVCFGDPKVKAGTKINITKIGERFSGKYYVTAATHIYREGRYETHFSMSGQLPNTLSELLHEGGSSNQGLGLVQGPMVGIVTNLKDPNNLGRFKVKFPTLVSVDGPIESNWVRIASPMAGKDRGFFYLPEVNDEVLVGFELGDLTRPYMLGMLWNSKDAPPLQNSAATGSGGKVTQRMLKSFTGHTILFDDTEGQEKIIVRDKTGKNEIIIDSKLNTMTINMEKDINVTAKGNMTFKANGDISMECRNMNIKALQNYKVEATTNIDMQAMANGTYTAKGSAMFEGVSTITLTSGAAEIIMSTPSVTVNKGALVVS